MFAFLAAYEVCDYSASLPEMLGDGFHMYLAHHNYAPATRRRPQRRKGIKHLDGISRLPTDDGQALLDDSFDLPQVGGLAYEQRAISEAWEKGLIVRAKVVEAILVGGILEIFAADLHGDHRFIRQDWGKPALPQGIAGLDHLIVLAARQYTVMIK
jgi:hypothetical protein